MSQLIESALTTVEAVKATAGIDSGDQDFFIARKINVYSQLFAESTDRKWEYTESTVEKVAQPRGSQRLQVNNYLPIDEVIEIKLGDETIDPDTYAIESSESGFIRRIDTTWNTTETWRYNDINPMPFENLYLYEVTYSGGYITPKQSIDGLGDRNLPYDVEDAVIHAVVTDINQRGVDPNIVSVKVGDGTTKFQSSGNGTRISPVFQACVKRYKQVSVL